MRSRDLEIERDRESENTTVRGGRERQPEQEVRLMERERDLTGDANGSLMKAAEWPRKIRWD